MSRFVRIVSACIAVALAGCSGGGGGPVAPSNATNPSSATRSYLIGDAQTVRLPSIDACGGRVSLPSGSSIPPGTTLTLTTSLAVAQTLPFSSGRAKTLATGQLNVLCYVTFTPSKTIQLPSVPAFAVDVAPSISVASQQFYYAVTVPTQAGDVASFRTEGPATISGHTLSFAASPAPLVLMKDTSYVFAFYSTAVPAAVATEDLFVATYTGVSIFDVTAGVKPLPFITDTSLSNPVGMALGSSGVLYLSDGSSENSTIHPYDVTHGNKVLPIIGAFGANFLATAISADGRLYQAYDGGSTNTGGFIVLDTAHGNAELANVQVGQSVLALAVDRSGILYVAFHVTTEPQVAPATRTQSTSTTDTVYEYDTNHGYVQRSSFSIPVGSARYMSIDGSGRLYVPYGDSSVKIFDTAHGNVALAPIVGGGISNPQGTAIDSRGRLFVTNGSPTNSVSVFDTAHANAPIDIIRDDSFRFLAGGVAVR